MGPKKEDRSRENPKFGTHSRGIQTKGDRKKGLQSLVHHITIVLSPHF